MWNAGDQNQISYFLVLGSFAFAFAFLVVLNESVVSELAVVLFVAGFLFVFLLRSFALLLLDALTSGNTGADLDFLLTLLLSAFARGFFEIFHLSLAISAQSGQAILFGVAGGLEVGALFVLGRGAAVEDGADTLANGVFLGAACEFLIVFLVSKVFASFMAFSLFSGLLWEGEVRYGFLDAGFEVSLHCGTDGPSAFPALGAVTVMFASLVESSFVFLGFRWCSAAIVRVTSINFGLQSFEFRFFSSLGLLVAVSQTLVEGLEFSRAVKSQSRSNNAGDEEGNRDGFHFHRILK